MAQRIAGTHDRVCMCLLGRGSVRREGRSRSRASAIRTDRRAPRHRAGRRARTPAACDIGRLSARAHRADQGADVARGAVTGRTNRFARDAGRSVRSADRRTDDICARPRHRSGRSAQRRRASRTRSACRSGCGRHLKRTGCAQRRLRRSGTRDRGMAGAAARALRGCSRGPVAAARGHRPPSAGAEPPFSPPASGSA